MWYPGSVGLGKKGEGIKQTKHIRTNKKTTTTAKADKGMVVTRRKRWWAEVEDGKGGINGDGRRLDWGGEHTVQCTDDVL